MTCHILIYKEGSSAEIRGVKCDFLRIPIGDFYKYHNAGWVKDIKKLYQEPKPKRRGRPKAQ